MAAAAAAAGGASAGGSGGIGTEPDAANEAAFPVRGEHVYGDGLGAGRGHQGQDLLANCGNRLVAARAGRVQVKDFQASGAGKHVVVDGKGTSKDFVYMHMKRVLVRKGERVAAGETIGRVGDTGRTTACHLHFEIWSGPGWYEGGDPVNPTRPLRRWDRDH
mgnify:FL=1